MTITMNAPMTSRGLEVEVNSDSPEVQALLNQIREASNGRLLKSEGLEISTTQVKSTNPVVQQQYNELMNQIAIATSSPELQKVAAIPATDNVVSQNNSSQLWQDQVKKLDMSWNVSPKGDKTFVQLAAESKPKNLGLGV